MKKIFTLFFGLSLLFIIGSCNDDDTPKSMYDNESLVGEWKPIEMVENIVVNDILTDSNSYVFTACQQQSRFIFDEFGTGKRTTYGMLGGSCVKTFDNNMNYYYIGDTGEINIQYISTEDNGYVSNLTEDSMNLTIEEIEVHVDNTDPDNIITTKTYTSKTYTLVRVVDTP